MHCPKCSAENHESRSKCWQCAANLSEPSDAPPKGTSIPRHSAPSRPRRIESQLGWGSKAGILAASFLLPIAGLIWGIVWLTSRGKDRKTWGTVGVVTSVVFGATWGIGVSLTLMKAATHEREEARQSICLSNQKQLAVGMLMYAQDYDEVFPDARNWRRAVYPYVANELIFECPNGGQYAMNPKLSRVNLMRVHSPAETVLLYEVDSQGRWNKDAHHGGSNYAFVDGHCRWLPAREAPDF